MKTEDAASLHNRILVCDTHCDTVDRILNRGVDIGERSARGHIDIPRLREGGVDVQVFASCIIRGDHPSGHYVKLALRMLDALRNQFDKHSDAIQMALTAGDIHRAKESGRISAVLAIEGGEAIEDDLAILRSFYRLGVRIMTLTWNSTNWADASQEPAKYNGLTDFGKDVVKEMNRLGMIVDVSHASDKTTWDALKISSAPIIASHSCAKAICNHPRNVNDELIKAIADSGGAVFVNFYSVFLDEKFKQRSRDRLALEPPPLSKLIDHIDHIANIGGIGSVGLGSDFDGMNPPPKGLDDVSKMPLITAALLERGYSERDIGRIMGGNFLRIFTQVCGS